MNTIRRRPEAPAIFAAAVWTGLHLPARQAVRHELVATLIAELHDALTNTTTSDTEAYEVFVRAVALLSVYVVGEERR
ncbi:hypothetical protein [Micromonospora marina]|uniref:hypothetical protein n=1 Tax=Micromonospora marina TaxID=307120 RepID=UPI003D70716E